MLHELAPRSSRLRAWPASPALDAGSMVAAVAEAAAGAAAPFFLQDLLLPLAVVPFAPSTPALLESWHGRRVGHWALGTGTWEGLPEPVRAPPTSTRFAPASETGSWGAALRSQSAAAWTRMVGRGGCMGGGGPSCLSQLQFEKSETWKPQRKTGVGTSYPSAGGAWCGWDLLPRSGSGSVLLQRVLSLPCSILLPVTFLPRCQCSESISM